MFNESAKMKVREVGRRIMVYRKAAGLDQEALAKKLGVSTMTVSRWERGKTAIPLNHWEAMLAVTFRPNEPYPVPSHTGKDETPTNEHVTKTILDPALIAELKRTNDKIEVEMRAMRESLGGIVRDAMRDSMRDLNAVLPALVRDALRQDNKDLTTQLAAFGAAITEVRNVAAGVSITVKEALLAAPQPVKHSNKPQREYVKSESNRASFDAENPEVIAILKRTVMCSGRELDVKLTPENVFGAVKEDHPKAGKDVDNPPTNRAAIQEGLRVGLNLKQPPDESAIQSAVDKITANLVRLGFPYGDSQTTKAMVEEGVVKGYELVSSIPPPKTAEQIEAERIAREEDDRLRDEKWKKAQEAISMAGAKREAARKELGQYPIRTARTIMRQMRDAGLGFYFEYTTEDVALENITRHIEHDLLNAYEKAKEGETVDRDAIAGAYLNFIAKRAREYREEDEAEARKVKAHAAQNADNDDVDDLM